MATVFTLNKLMKFLAVFLTVAMHISCLIASGAGVGHYERDLSRVDKLPRNTESNTHRHRHHKSAKSRSTMHKHKLREEKDKLSEKEREFVENKTANKTEDIHSKSSVDKMPKYEEVKKPNSSIDKKESKHKTEHSVEQNLPQKNLKHHSKEKSISKTIESTLTDKPVSQPLENKDAEYSPVAEELSYTDQTGELHNVQGFFDDNSTLSDVTDDFESLSPSNDSHSHPPGPDCHECRLKKKMREAIRENRKLAIKQQILNVLRMEKPPNATGMRYPKAPAFLHLYQNNENLMMADDPSGGSRKRNRFQQEDVDLEEEPVRTKAVYLRAQSLPEDLMLNISDGIYFKLPSQLFTAKIKRAHMWVYLNRPSSPSNQNYIELSMSLVAPETKASERVVLKLMETKKINIGKRHKPWRQIDIKKILEFWTKRPDLNLGLQLTALDGNGNNLVVLPPDEEYAPLVMVTLGRVKAHSRHRRSQSLVCTDRSHESRCCRYPLEIGFVEMGWEWIIAPTTVDANYCAGECHMAMMDATPRSWIAQQMEVGAGSCCVATRMQPLSLLYFDDDGTILFQILQDVKVSTCGCA